MKIFETYTIKNVLLKNRIVLPPMCLDMAKEDGLSNEFHYVHYLNRAIGGIGLIILEATAVAANGRITDKDLGLWQDSQMSGLKNIVEGCHKYGSKVALQLGHAGRKCELKNETIIAPTALPFNENYQIPKALTTEKIKEVIEDFKKAAIRADDAGFDAIEIHGAHGYLIHEFLSPLTNKRTDHYGGSLENRVRFLKELLYEIKKIWPKEKLLLLRVSAEDYKVGGIDVEEMISMLQLVKKDIDIIHVSSGGIENVPIKVFPGYQVTFAERIKKACCIPTIAVGLITEMEQVEEILNNGRSDLVALGRELLRNPYWLLHVAQKNDVEYKYPESYIRAFQIRKTGF